MRRVKRLLTRALLVAGGTLAGTAAAWALSTAPASAQVADPDDVVAAVTQVVADRPVPEVLAPVGEIVQGLDASVLAQRATEAAPPDLVDVADGLRGTFDQVGVRFEPNLPALSAPVRTGAPVGLPVETESRRVETAPAATAVPISVGTPVVRGPFEKFSETWASTPVQPLDVLPDESQDHSQPGVPAGPPFVPFAPPLGVPAQCSCVGDGSGSAGGNSGPFTAESATTTDSAVARALLPATERNTVMPGKSPGITPD
ncbi:hypothetical protein ABZ816_13910 [Actinosynnema sp. NPDC047251]|uniref:hypothetical protein n=1 Tax=Saccharothrix espanaensis TaxID=103731 RepID=UPI0011DE32D8|nr:hypothetical protein [Saccharothrix espanaensis]